MDPEATLKRIDDFLRAGETGEEVDEWCESLMEWLVRGGFEPDWTKYPLGASYYRCHAIQATRYAPREIARAVKSLPKTSKGMRAFLRMLRPEQRKGLDAWHRAARKRR